MPSKVTNELELRRFLTSNRFLSKMDLATGQKEIYIANYGVLSLLLLWLLPLRGLGCSCCCLCYWSLFLLLVAFPVAGCCCCRCCCWYICLIVDAVVAGNVISYVAVAELELLLLNIEDRH